MYKMTRWYKKKRNILVWVLCCCIGVFGIVFFVVFNREDGGNVLKDIDESNDSDIMVDKKIMVVDMDSNKRPYAVMINNHEDSRPQVGLMDAYIVYEFLVEGGITRMMALYTFDKDTTKIGSVRSSRHYYLDYVMENDAIYVHWGYSTYAFDDIKELGIDNVNGLIYGDKYFYTDNSLHRSIEHTRFTSMSLIKQAVDDMGYRTERNGNYLFNYTTDLVDLSKLEGNRIANEVYITFSKFVVSSYQYNSNDGYYYRSINGDNHVDLITGEQYKFKNIILYSVKYNSISSKGHLDLENIGCGDGYYITNGYGIPIKWEKKDRVSQTVYSYLDGTEIDVSDGNTFIEIYPTSGNLTIS